MCVGVACRLPVGPDGEDIWVLGKNRDRNYVPTIKFKKRSKGTLEFRYIEDQDTLWSEGVNSVGICIINTSLMVVDDEKEFEKKGKKGELNARYNNKVATTIRNALRMRDVYKAAKYILDSDVRGYNFVTDGKDMYLIENVREMDPNTREDGKTRNLKEHKSMTKIVDEEFVVRTNHGTIYNETGYLLNTPDGKSSRNRQKAVEDAIKSRKPKTLEELLACMSVAPNKDPNLNPVRLKGKCKLYTTGQYIINPFTKSLYYYPCKGACKMIEDGAKVSADDVKDKHDKTSMYILKTQDEISNVGDIKESLTFKEFFYNN